MDNDCLFCRIVAGEIPATVVHETATTLAFRDIDPKAPVHVLVIPKAHHRDVLALAGDGFRLIFNTGGHGGQEVFHVHAHVLGGKPLGAMVSR